MLCQNCHKNEATVHIQKIVDGQVTSFHLCEACAAKKGADDPDLPELNLAEVLFDLAASRADGQRIWAPTFGLFMNPDCFGKLILNWKR